MPVEASVVISSPKMDGKKIQKRERTVRDQFLSLHAFQQIIFFTAHESSIIANQHARIFGAKGRDRTLPNTPEVAPLDQGAKIRRVVKRPQTNDWRQTEQERHVRSRAHDAARGFRIEEESTWRISCSGRYFRIRLVLHTPDAQLWEIRAHSSQDATTRQRGSTDILTRWCSQLRDSYVRAKAWTSSRTSGRT